MIHTPKTAFLFLPLLAASTLTLAPPADAQAARPESAVERSTPFTNALGSASGPALKASASKSSAKVAQSRGSGSRGSSGSTGSSRSSSGSRGSLGSSGSSRSSSGSRGSSFGGSRSSGSSLFGSSGSRSTPSRTTTPVRPSPTPSVRVDSSTRYVAPTPATGSRSTGSVTYGRPDSASAGGSSRVGTTPAGTTGASGLGDAGRSSSSRGATPVGETYVPRTAFPTPGTSGSTTYSRRFNGGLDMEREASAERGGTLGANGRGSVSSALEALRREDEARRNLRAPDSPGARFRAAERNQRLVDDGVIEYERRFVSAPGPAAPSDPSARRTQPERLEDARLKSARLKNARYDHAAETNRLVNKRLTNPNEAKLIDAGAAALGYATGTAVGAATRTTLGAGGARVAATAFGGYGGVTPGGTATGSGSSFGGYGGYAPGETISCGILGGYWDSSGYYHAPYSSWWNFGLGWSSGWGFYVGANWCSPYYSPYYKSNWYSPWWWCSPYAYYPTWINHCYDEPEVTVHVYADGAVGESSTYGTANDVYVDAGAIYDAGYQDGAAASQPYVTAAVAPAPAPAPAPAAAPAPAGKLNSASLRYLELGDVAFHGARYTDAVHFYNRAIEFEGERGMLHLVLSDALFATGDYHASAASLRRALALDPMLVAAPVDKHNFYGDPTDFDQQLARLELFFKDNPTDADARLVLALNYLFGGRPLAAVELLEKAPTHVYGELDMAAALILDSARLARWGANPPAEAGWK